MHKYTTSHLLRVFFIIFIIALLGIIWQRLENYKTPIKDVGGSFTEGVIGSPRFINPVLAQSQVDYDLSNLIFTPIVSIDRDGSVHYEAAESIDALNNGLTYRLRLRDDILFHDNKRLTSKDVLFTINSIQDPLIKSPLSQQWEGIEVEIIDNFTLEFTLIKPFNDFIYNLEIGILPEHIWRNINPQEFIFSTYNSEPIGSGPYKIKDISQKDTGSATSYTLTRFSSYFRKSYIKNINFVFFDNEKKLINGLENRTVDAAYGISSESIKHIDKQKIIYQGTLPRVFALFFNQERQPFFESEKIREAINLVVNKNKISEEIFSGFASPINSALGFVDTNHTPNKTRAIELIESDGWVKNQDGYYQKIIDDTTQELNFSIALPNLEDMIQVSEFIQSDLAEIGIRVNIRPYDQGNLSQNIIRNRDYESLLFGYEIKKPSDLYAFWHSSQISDPGLNISLFENSTVDKELEKLRSESINDFEIINTNINEMIPAVFLYSPSYIYVLPSSIQNTKLSVISSEDRFNQVHDWFIETRSIWNIFIQK